MGVAKKTKERCFGSRRWQERSQLTSLVGYSFCAFVDTSGGRGNKTECCTLRKSHPFTMQINRDFKIPRRRRQRERQKSHRLNRQNNNSHAFLYISLPSLHDYDEKMPNFTFYGGRKQVTAKFSFSFWTWIWFLGIRKWQSKWVGVMV